MKEIKLSNGNIALIDDDDFEMVSKWKWQENQRGYAKGKVRINDDWKTVSMHRFIMKPPSDKVVDHINHNKLDNRKSNLRICTPQQNSANVPKLSKTKNYKGVRYKNGGYEASLVVKGEYKYIGSYSSEIAAANAYNYYAKQYNGEFAYLNNLHVNMGKDEFEQYRLEKKITSKFKGVGFNKQKQKWLVRLQYNRKSKFIGWFDSEIEGALAYDQYIIENNLNKQLNFAKGE